MISDKKLKQLEEKGAEQFLSDITPKSLTHLDDQRAYQLGASFTIIDALVNTVAQLEKEVSLERNRYEQLLTKLENLNK